MIDNQNQDSPKQDQREPGDQGAKKRVDAAAKKKPRRSLFSVLFQSNNHGKQVRDEDEELRQKRKEESVQDGNNNEHSKLEDLDEVSEALSGDESSQEPGDNHEEDEDSYQLDLNRRLESEKAARKEQVISPSAVWHNNDNYVGASENWIDTIGRDEIKGKALNNVERGEKKASNWSPLLEQFLSSHKILLDDDDTSTGSQEDDFSSSLSCCSNKRRWPIRRDEEQTRSEMRLVNWRSRLTSRSPASSDSELDLLDCQSPALVITCSESDTSCSSVELIWSRASELQRPQSEQRQQQSRQVVQVQQLDIHPSPVSISPEVAGVQRQKTSQQRLLSILELARPSRAKSRRTWTPTDSKQWVANPLFDIDASSDVGEGCLRIPPKKGGIRSSSASISSCSSGCNSRKSSDTSSSCETKHKVPRKSKSRVSSNKRDSIYFSHFHNLDKRIKSNVSSIRNQLSEKISDTSKRASILADQLITSIKDTTKEQLSFGLNNSARDNRSLDLELEKSSFSPNQPNHQVDSLSRSDKGKLFSLIYLHQQQANGQPVITRQPMPSGGLKFNTADLISATQTNSSKLAEPAKLKRENSVKAISVKKQFNERKRSSIKEFLLTPFQVQQQESQKTAGKSLPVEDDENIVDNNSEAVKATATSDCNSLPKLQQETTTALTSTGNTSQRKVTNRRRLLALKRRAERTDINVNKDDEDEEGEIFYQTEYDKFRRTTSNLILTSKKSQTTRRSLNYWRRYKMRKMGINLNLVHLQRSQSSEL